MRLVGVPQAGGGAGQVNGFRGGVDRAYEALEAQHALERLRAVADRRVGSPAEVAFAEAYPRGDILGARGRVAEQGRGRADGGIRGGVGDQAAGYAEEPVSGHGRAQGRRKLAPGVLQQVADGDALVAEAAQRQAEDLAARRRAERLFAGGAAEPVRDAVAAYRNADGGFGHALEPDCRAAASQPAAVEMALRVLDLAGAWDEHLVRDAVDWLASVAPAEGGTASALPTVSEGPHAPWWAPARGLPASLIQTGQIAGLLYSRGFAHPWLDRATDVMWSGIEKLAKPNGTGPGGYEMFGVLAFLEHVPDRPRAEKAFGQVGPLLLSQGIVTLDPEAEGETHSPLDFAPLPTSIARSLFDQATIDAHLGHLAAAQRADGGWTFNWPSWSPAAESEWRGFLTVGALRVLRANGRW